MNAIYVIAESSAEMRKREMKKKIIPSFWLTHLERSQSLTDWLKTLHLFNFIQLIKLKQVKETPELFISLTDSCLTEPIWRVHQSCVIFIYLILCGLYVVSLWCLFLGKFIISFNCVYFFLTLSSSSSSSMFFFFGALICIPKRVCDVTKGVYVCEALCLLRTNHDHQIKSVLTKLMAHACYLLRQFSIISNFCNRRNLLFV